MAFAHGKSTVFKIGSTNLSAYCDSVEVKRAADSHDTTTFGQSAHTYLGGLIDGTISVKGKFDDGDATNPRVTFQGALGTTLVWTYQATGTASGSPQLTGSGVLTSYEESAPVADLVTWGAELQITGTVTTTDQ
jgi:hypothetical protein